MRRTITFFTRHRSQPSRAILRLFRMNEAQSKFYGRAVLGITSQACPAARAIAVVEAVIVGFLQGKEPDAKAPADLRLGRQLFPVLTDREIEQLPRAGCPVGRIEALVFQIASGGEQRAVRFSFTVKQANAFNAAIEGVQIECKINRDDAWLEVTRMVGRLVQGATVSATALPCVVALASVFKLTVLEELPTATEDDLQRWTFTTAPLLLMPA